MYISCETAISFLFLRVDRHSSGGSLSLSHTHLFLILDPIADIRSEVVTQLKVGSPDERAQRDQLLKTLSYSWWLPAVSTVCTPGI